MHGGCRRAAGLGLRAQVDERDHENRKDQLLDSLGVKGHCHWVQSWSHSSGEGESLRCCAELADAALLQSVSPTASLGGLYITHSHFAVLWGRDCAPVLLLG